jgi:acyl dehydratase
VHEGDTLRSTVTVEDVRPGAGGTHVVDLRSVVTADATDGGDPRPVLDWRFSGWC